MIIFPAVDIKDGQAVRLRRGRADDVTVFSPDPVSMAAQWQAMGARFLHIVDLDGAFAGSEVNLPLITRMRNELSIPVQVGGGIRSLAAARKYVEAGADRCIIGTMALEDPDGYAALCEALPGKIGVSLDAEGGKLKTKGWVADSGLTVDDVLPRLEKTGTAFIVYTDIDRDGMQTGVNVPALEALAKKSSIPVIAAGGVATLDDIKALYPISRTANLEGAISGRALYEGTLDLREAMDWIRSQEQKPGLA
ncbi:1-(5-phosphoribosyl)-5-((5-phosphoribosylamino)methylideneamino) imidazole-4-carboxamide isomerase [uncultured delta proteobacterium]|uniref:1-(5-phosphoribosyl)-5-[(5-phosphoribosylamino)methylideneamino] imidazole-4-carboxamide isomerase n=1 Tax=uncultured delta proteobacterium TaxID=34034 RepID=A0A212J7G3_9DELT|nr:1-(5-phosphoribosyl)-5-((5-phosphoribosylamino)methylideneamino) imidazole-4-carboxamide isomerase [uncultured delta proteobacterium]